MLCIDCCALNQYILIEEEFAKSKLDCLADTNMIQFAKAKLHKFQGSHNFQTNIYSENKSVPCNTDLSRITGQSSKE